MWLWPNVLGACKIWWPNEIQGALYKKNKICAQTHVHCLSGICNSFVWRSFDVIWPPNFASTYEIRSQSMPRSFGFFIYLFWFYHSSWGAPNLGVATTFPCILLEPLTTFIPITCDVGLTSSLSVAVFHERLKFQDQLTNQPVESLGWWSRALDHPPEGHYGTCWTPWPY